MAVKRSLTNNGILDLLDQDDDNEWKENSGRKLKVLKAEAIKKSETGEKSDKIYQDFMGKLKDVEQNQSDNFKKRRPEDGENTVGTLKRLKTNSQGDPRTDKRSSTSCKSDKTEKKSDPFNEEADRSVDRLREIMGRKKPVPFDVYTASYSIFQPNPTVMARWILEEMKAPQLKLHLKANWHLVKARDRLRGAPTTKKPVLELLIPVLAQKIERDRAEK